MILAQQVQQAQQVLLDRQDQMGFQPTKLQSQMVSLELKLNGLPPLKVRLDQQAQQVQREQRVLLVRKVSKVIKEILEQQERLDLLDLLDQQVRLARQVLQVQELLLAEQQGKS